MKPSVILYKTLPDDLQQRLEKHFTVTQVKNLSPDTVQQHAEAFAQAEGLLGSSEKVDAALLEKMPRLRATSTISVGYDNFDVEALNARKVLLMHTPTVLTETVADTVMALVLSTSRRVVEVANRVKAGEWTKSIARTGSAAMCTIKRWGSWAWAVSGWPWRSARTPVLACRFCITPAAVTRRRKNALTRVTAIWIRCCRKPTLSV